MGPVPQTQTPPDTHALACDKLPVQRLPRPLRRAASSSTSAVPPTADTEAQDIRHAGHGYAQRVDPSRSGPRAVHSLLRCKAEEDNRAARSRFSPRLGLGLGRWAKRRRVARACASSLVRPVRDKECLLGYSIVYKSC